jgi:hypothetical protein
MNVNSCYMGKLYTSGQRGSATATHAKTCSEAQCFQRSTLR